MNVQDVHAEYMKVAFRDVERYLLLCSSSSIIFVVFSFAKHPAEDSVPWQLLGVTLDINVPLALVFLYLMHVISGWLADHTLLYIRDVANEMPDVAIRDAMLMHPSLITVGPIGQLMASLAPAMMVLTGVYRLDAGDVFTLSRAVWWLIYGAATAGIVVYLHILFLLGPRLKSGSVGRWLENGRRSGQRRKNT